MNSNFQLRKSITGELLVPAIFDKALAAIARANPDAPRGGMHGQELRFGRKLAIEDDVAAGFVLDFMGQGARVGGSANGPSAALLGWALAAVAERLKCEFEGDPGEVGDANRYLDAYEADVAASRKEHNELEGPAFVAWLAREEHLELEDNAVIDEISLADPAALYEQLLDSLAVADVFVSERELARLLTRFKARAVRR